MDYQNNEFIRLVNELEGVTSGYAKPSRRYLEALCRSVALTSAVVTLDAGRHDISPRDAVREFAKGLDA